MSHSFPLHHFLLSPRPCSSCAVHSSFGSLSSDSFLSLSDLANSPSFLSLRLVAFVPYLFQPPPIFSIHSTSLARSTSLSLSLCAQFYTRQILLLVSSSWKSRLLFRYLQFLRLNFPGLDLIPRFPRTTFSGNPPRVS